MSETKSKKVVVKLHDDEVINLVEGVPRGYRSVVIESALRSYLRTEVGQELIQNLTRRNKKNGAVRVTKGSLFKRLEGDF